MVRLPMPTDISDSNNVAWGQDQVNNISAALTASVGNNLKGTAIGAGAGKISGALGGPDLGGLGVAIGALAGSGVSGEDIMKMANKGTMINQTLRTTMQSRLLAMAGVQISPEAILARGLGVIPNSNMELLFNAPALREFAFSWKMTPRDEYEAKKVRHIIRFFKQGMLPIRSKSNLFLKAPNTFQLTYKTKGEIHPYLNSFKECALKSCDVNYTPENSYSTYTDSVMTAYSMTLAFGELEPIYNDDYGVANEEHLNFSATYDQGDGTIAETKETPDGTTFQSTIDPTFGHEIRTFTDKQTTIYDSDGNFTKEYLQSQTGGGSDIRIKENIVKVSQSPSGLNIYEWNYKSAPNSRYRGVMAQEVMKVVPEAVYAEEDGFLSVYYNLIDVNMELV